MTPLNVRVSAAFTEADLAAAVRPGVTAIYLPLAESSEQVQRAEALIRHYERERGIRPGSVAIRPLIETPKGVASASDVAASSQRIHEFGAGPKLFVHLDTEPGSATVDYAQAECELVARALDLEPATIEFMGD